MTADKVELDEGVAAYVRSVQEALKGLPPPVTPDDRRRIAVIRSRLVRAETPAGLDVSDHYICAPGREIPFRLYRPSGSDPKPTVLYMHGGGWVSGDSSTHETVTAPFAAGSGAAVVSLHYRRAPENPFPAAFEDALFALRWLGENGADLGLDPSRIVVAGDSAGGNLAAGLAIAARDGDGPALKGQVLLYPVLDDDTGRPSYRADRDVIMKAASMRFYLDCYLPDPAARDDWRALPMRRRDLTGLAPAYVIAAEYDTLHDEALDYAARLQAAGVPTALRDVPGTIHGFLRAHPVSGLARTELAALCDATRAMLAR